MVTGSLPHRDLLEAADLSKLGQLEVLATRILEGFLSGRHASPYKGSSVEFAEHRNYSPGDEVRLIDWRVYGRSDRYYIKQFEQETNLQCWLVLDASGSMGFGSNGMTKLRYAQIVTAALAMMLLRQQDAAGLVCADAGIRQYIPPRAQPDHLRVLLEGLSGMQPGGKTALAAVLHELARRIRRRGLVVVLSDCFDDVDPLCRAMHHLHARGNELLLFHVLAPEEVTFAVDRWSRFECLEGTEHPLELDPAAVREGYLAEFSRFVQTLRHGCGEVGCDYVQLLTSTPPGSALAHYLAARTARMKR